MLVGKAVAIDAGYRYFAHGRKSPLALPSCSLVATTTSLVTAMVMLTGFDWFVVKVQGAGSMFSRPYQETTAATTAPKLTLTN